MAQRREVVNVYFAHSFSGQGQSVCLRKQADTAIVRFVKRLDGMGIALIDPAEIDLTSPHARFECCLSQIRSSDLLLIDARYKLGLGVGAEMMFAKSNGIPVFSIVPPRSHYRSISGDEGIYHAFVCGLTSKIFLSFDDCAVAINAMQSGVTRYV
jgi:hypothetical protein